MFAIVGSRTTRDRQARGRGLSVYAVDADASRWRLVQTVEAVNPSFLCADAATQRLYTVHGDGSQVSAYAVDGQGQLQMLNRQSTQGRNPVHLALSSDGRMLLVANYASGSLAALPIDADGALAPCSSVLALTGDAGPYRAEQKGPHPHQVLRWPGTDALLVADKGTDRVHVVSLLPDGSLQARSSLRMRSCSGPRHAAVDAQDGRVWVCNELDSTITACRFDPRTGGLQPTHTVPLLPADFVGDSRAAGIALHPRGHMLYASNRGADAVTVLAIDAGTGKPEPLQWRHCRGRTPRFLTLTPDASALIVANEASDTLVRFGIGADGLLDEGRPVADTGSPVCVVFLPTPPRHSRS